MVPHSVAVCKVLPTAIVGAMTASCVHAPGAIGADEGRNRVEVGEELAVPERDYIRLRYVYESGERSLSGKE